jgi:AcrR family transcriptional regulator
MPESPARTSGAPQRMPAASRRRVAALDAFIDLVLEGNLPPTPNQVAERSGISIATFFRYFESLNAMRHAAATRMLERFPLLELRKIGEGTLHERVETFVALRVALWEKVSLLARLQRSVVLQDKDAAKMIDDVRGVMVNQIRALVAMLTSVESWEQFRLAYRRSPLQTRRAWANTIKAILQGGDDR